MLESLEDHNGKSYYLMKMLIMSKKVQMIFCLSLMAGMYDIRTHFRDFMTACLTLENLNSRVERLDRICQ